MDIRTRLQEDIKTAMRAQDKARLSVLRLMITAVKQVEIDNPSRDMPLSDSEVVTVFDKMLKQRRESIRQYEQARRQDLADQEKYEMDLIQTYMPIPLTDTEISQLISEAIAACQAKSIQDMGKVMNILKPKIQGRADMSQVGAVIKQQLS